MANDSPPPRHMVSTDVVILTPREARLEVLLVQRANDPYAGKWALPGGFVEEDEDLEESARRELREETGVDGEDVFLEQLGAWGEPDRDPRGRVITVAYWALVPPDELEPEAADDAAEVDWFDTDGLPALAFDHGEIVEAALRRLRGSLERPERALRLLSADATLEELRALYRAAGVELPEE